MQCFDTHWAACIRIANQTTLVNSTPHLRLTLQPAGGHYSTAYPAGKGVIFSYYIETGSYSLLHSFASDATDGANPQGSLTLDSSANVLYGTASEGGQNSSGVLFSYNIASSTYKILHVFTGCYTNNGYAADGQYPQGVALDSNSNTLYGATQ